MIAPLVASGWQSTGGQQPVALLILRAGARLVALGNDPASLGPHGGVVLLTGGLAASAGSALVAVRLAGGRKGDKARPPRSRIPKRGSP